MIKTLKMIFKANLKKKKKKKRFLFKIQKFKKLNKKRIIVSLTYQKDMKM